MRGGDVVRDDKGRAFRLELASEPDILLAGVIERLSDAVIGVGGLVNIPLYRSDSPRLRNLRFIREE